MRSAILEVRRGGVVSELRLRVYRMNRQMRDAVKRFNGVGYDADTLAVTQLQEHTDGRQRVYVRLSEEDLDLRIVAHEAHHAASSFYRVGTAPESRLKAHATHYNEDAAYMYGDLLRWAVEKLEEWKLPVRMEL